MWLVVGPVVMFWGGLPSPNAQLYWITVRPGVATLRDPSKFTVKGARPNFWLTAKFAAGATFVKSAISTVSAWTFPRLSSTRTHVDVPPTLLGKQPPDEGYEICVLPVPTTT